ncbi:unnamed protein product [Musa acuminata subsp. burmannicoides]
MTNVINVITGVTILRIDDAAPIEDASLLPHRHRRCHVRLRSVSRDTSQLQPWEERRESRNRKTLGGETVGKNHHQSRGIFSIEAPPHVSNVQVAQSLDMIRRLCRIVYKYLEDGTKVTVSTGLAASGARIPHLRY